MPKRKKIIEDILNNLQIIKNKMYFKFISEPARHITHSQWFVLSIINKNFQASLKDVSKMLGISPSAATQLVNSLVDNGYVARSVNAKDRREADLVISKKGKKELIAMKKKQILMAETLFKVLSEQELKSYLKIQNKILSNLVDRPTE